MLSWSWKTRQYVKISIFPLWKLDSFSLKPVRKTHHIIIHWTMREVLNFNFCDDDTSFKGSSPTEPKLLLCPELTSKLTSSQLCRKLQFVFGAGLTPLMVLGDLSNTCKPEAGREGWVGREGSTHLHSHWLKTLCSCFLGTQISCFSPSSFSWCQASFVDSYCLAVTQQKDTLPGDSGNFHPVCIR